MPSTSSPAAVIPPSIIEEPKAPRAADKSNSITEVTRMLTISELMVLLLDLGC